MRVRWRGRTSVLPAVRRYAGDTTKLASPTRPMTPTSSPAAASTTTQSPTNGDPGSASATAHSPTARPPVASAHTIATAVTVRRGARAESTAPSAGAAVTPSASSSRLVTQAPERRGVARAELGEDALVEDRGNERDAELDPDRGGRAGQL